MVKWDYVYKKVKVNDLEAQLKILKEFGEDGWELVLIRDDVDVEGASDALLKRMVE